MVEHKHPITPPLELVREWAQINGEKDLERFWMRLATQAARWGADQELEACCILLNGASIVPPDGAKTYPENQLAARERVANFRAARRPKPPSLAEQALMALEDGDLGPGASLTPVEVCIIRTALERLQELEHND